ncbi:unnamed protein product [Rotaria sp. Silwood2]|nr:unnamed protein product [Rotaria sp. Silwood2]
MRTSWVPRWLWKIDLKYNWKYERAYRLIHELAEKLVEEEQNKQSAIEDEQPKNLIVSLVSSLNEEVNDEHAASGLTLSEIFDEVLAMIVAGYETTSIALLWFIFFSTTRDTIVDDAKIHRGQTVFIAIHNINTDARYWHHAEPRPFVPERLLAEDQNHHPLTMIPFGGGHRACIGQELAWLELKMIIV